MASANESGEKDGIAALRAGQLLDRGLARYATGDLMGALSEWEEALAVDPSQQRAREYLEYVRGNFDALSAQFGAASEAVQSAIEQGVPTGDSPEDSDAYDSMVVQGQGSDGEDFADGLAQLDAGLAEVLELSAEDDDESLPAVEIEAMAPDEDVPGIAPELDGPIGDDDATIDVRVLPALRREYNLGSAPDFENLPPPGTRPHVMTIQPRQEHPVDSDLEAGALDLDLDIDATADARGPRHQAVPPARVQPAAPRPSIAPSLLGDDDETTHAYDRRSGVAVQPRRLTGFLEEVPTREHVSVRDSGLLPAGAGPLSPDDFIDAEYTGEYQDLRRTRDHNPFRDGASPQPAISDSHPPVGGDSSVIVDEDLLEGSGLADQPSSVRDPDRTSDFRPRRDTGRDQREERIRRRVGELLKGAEEAAGKGEFLIAVAAVEAVAREDEEGVIAPVMLHRHRDLLYRIYEGHIGDMHAVPLVAVPLHEIAGQSLDHRTGFLLSRIDGMLSFEDILDVAGMPRMEAYQILSNLLRKCVIEVR